MTFIDRFSQTCLAITLPVFLKDHLKFTAFRSCCCTVGINMKLRDVELSAAFVEVR